MARYLKNPFGIRFKLVFLSSFLLVIPWLGYQYILEMEDYLRRGQEQTVLGTARALATALNKIPRMLERFTERFLICPERVQRADFSRQTQLLQDSMDTLRTMVCDLRHSPDLPRMKERNDKLQYLEGEADKHMVELIRALYQANHDPVTVVALKDLYDLLEKVIDRCRDAGNVIVQIVLKNS